MKKNHKIIYAITVTLMLFLIGIWYYFFAVNKDTNGLTKEDVRQAGKTLISYIDAVNSQEYEKSLSFLSGFYTNKQDMMRKSFELGSGIIYDDFQADYIAENCRINLGSVQEQEPYAEYIADTKIVYFTCSFTVLARQEGSELGSGYIANMKYEEFGYYLVEEGEQWKILAWGY